MMSPNNKHYSIHGTVAWTSRMVIVPWPAGELQLQSANFVDPSNVQRHVLILRNGTVLSTSGTWKGDFFGDASAEAYAVR